MFEKILENTQGKGIPDREIEQFLREWLESISARKILLIPPDATRAYSGAGKITAIIYRLLKNRCQVDILPALGTHSPMGKAQRSEFFGPDIPDERYQIHHWRNTVVKIGEIPVSFTREVSQGLFPEKIDVEINPLLLDPSYDFILSIGQIVPHEVAGMAGYTKNVLVGCGGADMIHKSHMLGAVCGMENAMGQDHAPVRRVFDYAQKQFLNRLPLCYLLTVVEGANGDPSMRGIYAGEDRSVFEKAVRMSQRVNVIRLGTPAKRIVTYLDPKEYQSTWLGNKSIYRTRMAIAKAGELFVIAPGVCKFGEDQQIDRLIRKYGYTGRENILAQSRECKELLSDLAAAAHLIHGSTEGRFTVTYSPGGLTQEEIEGVGYRYIPLHEALMRYPLSLMKEGMNQLSDGEEIYFIRNPALGLWIE
jgi:nickel-dependent lactate racemase